MPALSLDDEPEAPAGGMEAIDLDFDDGGLPLELDLPNAAPAAPAAPPPAPPALTPRGTRVGAPTPPPPPAARAPVPPPPVPGRRPAPATPPPAPRPPLQADSMPADSAIDLPLPALEDSGVDLSAPTLEDSDPELPVPVDHGVDLPTPSRTGLPVPRGIDLSTPGMDEIDLPAPGLGEVDLPTPLEVDLPAPSGVDLPVPSGMDLPVPSGIDLPVPAADLPTPSGVDLPTPAADLPTPYGGEVIPAPSVDELDLDLDLDVDSIPEPKRTRPVGAPADGPRMPTGPTPVVASSGSRSRTLLFAGVGALALALVGSGLYVTGMLDGETTEAGGQRGLGEAKRAAGEPAAERADKVLAKLAADDPKSLQQAMSMAEAQGDAVGQAEAALLLHYRYGPDSVLAGQAQKLLEPYAAQSDAFVQRVVALQALASGDLATAAEKVPKDGPRANLYRGWVALNRDKLDDAIAAADAAIAENAEDVGALHLKHLAQIQKGTEGALDELRAAIQAHPDHPLLQLALVEALVDDGLLAEARTVADGISAGAASKAFQARVLTVRGHIANMTGDRSGAVLRFDQALELAPDAIDAAMSRLRVLVDSRDYAEVKSALEILLQNDPKLLSALLLRAEVAIATGEGEQAMEVLGEARAVAPDDARIALLVGEIHAMRVAVEDAQKAFAVARNADPTLVQTDVDEARLLARVDKLPEAMAVLEKARQAAVEREGGAKAAADLLVARAKLLAEAGRGDEAMQALDQALITAPGHPQALLDRGRLRLRNGDPTGGREDLVTLYERTGGYPGLAGPLGRLFIHENDIDALDGLLGKQLDDPRAPDDVVLVGARLRLSQNKLEAAKLLVDKILTKNPGNWEGHLVRAQISLLNGDSEAAYVEIQQARPKTTDAEVELWTGKILEANDDLDKALAHFRLAAETDPNLLEARYAYGLALARRGAAQQALDELEPVTRATEKFPGAWVATGMAYRDLGQTEKAVQAFRKASKLDPSLSEAFFWEGRIHAEKNKHGPAVAALAKAVEVEDQTVSWLPMAYRMLGRSYAETGKKAQAREAYERFLQLASPKDPGREEAKRRLRDL